LASRPARVYRVEVAPAADRALDALPQVTRARIVRKMEALGRDPRPRGCKKLHGEEDLYRVRAGDFRVVYAVRDAMLVVLVVKVGNRRDVYR
jgi:mRNA interferase RelE/StbE